MSINAADIKQLARKWGATLVGISPVERLAWAPKGHRPQDFVPGVQSVVVLGLPIPDTVINKQALLLKSEKIPDDIKPVNQYHIYERIAHQTVSNLAREVAYRLCVSLKDEGYLSCYFPVATAEGSAMASKIPNHFAPFSHRHAAVAAGLGTFGLNNLVITPKYGPRVRLESLVTQAPLEPDPMLDQRVCPEGCNICTEDWPECFGERYEFEVNGQVQQVARFMGCHIWRDFPPGATTHDVCFDGGCIRVCPIGAKLTGVRRGVAPREFAYEPPTILSGRS